MNDPDDHDPHRLSRGRFLGLGAGLVAMAITPLNLASRKKAAMHPTPRRP